MDDLVSRQWLIKCVNERWIKFDTERDENRFIHLVRDIAPSVELQITRCKDCKYSSSNHVYGCRLEPFDVNERNERMYSNDYCSKAILRGESDERHD